MTIGHSAPRLWAVRLIFFSFDVIPFAAFAVSAYHLALTLHSYAIAADGTWDQQQGPYPAAAAAASLDATDRADRGQFFLHPLLLFSSYAATTPPVAVPSPAALESPLVENHWAFSSLGSDLAPVLFKLLHLYLYAEALFLVHFLFWRARAQQPHIPERMPEAKRATFLRRILAELDAVAFRRFIAGWFYWRHQGERQLGASDFRFIHRGNVKDWVAWAFFSFASHDDMMASEEGCGFSDELEAIVSLIETNKGVTFPPGTNLRIAPVILNYNTVRAYPKPLVFYVAIISLDAAAHFFLQLWGFDRYAPGEPTLTSVTGTSDPDAEPSIAYWLWDPASNRSGNQPTTPAVHSAARDSDSAPIVFFHGIGGGLFCYMHFVRELLLLARGGRRALFLVELPHVCIRPLAASRPAPSPERTVAEVLSMLHTHGHPRAHFVGHSLGSAPCAWVLSQAPKAVAGAALVDPITFLTYHPHLAFNFVMRHPGRNAPARANELFTHWLASRDLRVSEFVSRHFCWHRNVLWPEDLPARHRIIVSTRDNLIDAPSVARYARGHGLHVTTYDADHGEFLIDPVLGKDIIGRLAASLFGPAPPKRTAVAFTATAPSRLRGRSRPTATTASQHLLAV
ncbi:hypothetical protein HK405_012133, partial [Cladochytrium tenue]